MKPYGFVICRPKEGIIENCLSCGDDKSECTIYGLVMDLTAIRDICPLDRTMEQCPDVVGDDNADDAIRTEADNICPRDKEKKQKGGDPHRWEIAKEEKQKIE